MVFFISLILSLVLGHLLVKLLYSLNVKQVIRDDGPKEHIKTKSYTPTMGGLIFLIPALILIGVQLIVNKDFQTTNLFIVFITTLTFAILGFIDDYLKIVKKQNKGISGWSKLLIQLIVSIGIFYIYKENNNIIYLLWIFFIISGSSNSYNLTDGLDGLLSSITLLSFLGFFILLLQTHNNELLYFIITLAGSLLGFLYFNKHPAKIFMGDTGSLALGGAIGSLAITTKTELFLILFATIPIIEALSVILQVLSCKLSKRFYGIDKRLFKMAPLHHHFELCGWKETEIVKRFFLFQILCVVIGVIIGLI